jgi:hypothetical protein
MAGPNLLPSPTPRPHSTPLERRPRCLRYIYTSLHTAPRRYHHTPIGPARALHQPSSAPATSTSTCLDPLFFTSLRPPRTALRGIAAMDRTPSPPRRVRTPPAPLHGSRYDNYEPFSPRRSSRVAAQHGTHIHPYHDQTTSPPRTRTVRDVTPTNFRPKSISRTAHFALSPPSPPSSPAKARSPRSTRRAQHDTAALDSDSEPFAPTPARRLLSAMAPHGMLPTPAKTPRKRALHTEESLRPTARVLFANRPSTVDDAMPTPRRAHKSMRSVLDIDSFGEQMSTGTPKIGVYVDSKERVPDREEADVNPFLTRRGKGKVRAAPTKERKVNEKTRQIFEAAARDEGIVYTQYVYNTRTSEHD